MHAEWITLAGWQSVPAWKAPRKQLYTAFLLRNYENTGTSTGFWSEVYCILDFCGIRISKQGSLVSFIGNNSTYHWKHFYLASFFVSKIQE